MSDVEIDVLNDGMIRHFQARQSLLELQRLFPDQRGLRRVYLSTLESLMGQWVRLPLIAMNREIQVPVQEALDIAGSH